MTQRERVLASSLVGILVLGGGFVLAQVAVIGPLRQLNGEIAAVDEDIRKKEDELKANQATIDRALKLSPRLADWKQLSLPGAKDARPEEVVAHLKTLQVDYEHYLYELMRRNGFTPGSIAVTSKPLEGTRATTAAAKNAPPPVTRPLTFTVQGQATLDGLVKMMEEFHRASLLQQVKGLTVQKSQERNAPRGTLDLTMTVEALLVSGADKRGELMPSSSSAKPRVLAEASRSYADLTGHNIFTGTPPKSASQTEESRDVLGFIKLTTVSNTNGRRWEAWLFDQSKRDGESRLRTTTGFNEFAYSDRFDNILVKGAVIRIDETGVLFKANGRFHHIGLGESLYDALREPAEAPLPAAGAALGAAWEAPW
jgi:hypothetical protein